MSTRKPCPGCKASDTYREVDAVCHACQGLLDFAVAETKRQAKDPELVLVRVPHSIQYLYGAGNVNYDLWACLHELCGALSAAIPPGLYPSTADAKDPFPRNKDSYISSDTLVRIPKAMLKPLGELVRLIVKAVELARADGKVEGSRLLFGLATGERSVQEFNKATKEAK